MNNPRRWIRLAGHIRSALKRIEHKLADIDSKLDHVIDVLRHERRSCAPAGDHAADLSGGDDDVFPEDR